MTKTTKTVFENYEIRKTKKQKTAFINYVSTVAEEHGYAHRIEKGYLGARNIVVGDPDTAKVVYTAHYDTCPRLPFPNFITPKCFPIYLLYQVAIVFLFMFLPTALLATLCGTLTWLFSIPEDIYSIMMFALEYIYLILLLWMLFAGPANKHTANDNTSGVTALLDLMIALPEKQRSRAAFVFFDLEEVGLFGSAGFASKHKRAMKQKLLINFDCVSDGEHLLFATRTGAKRFAPQLQAAYQSDTSVQVEIAKKGVFYPSDQMNFPCGVGVAALKKTKKLGLLYMNRIHTSRDTVYREENLRFLVEGSVKLTEIIE